MTAVVFVVAAVVLRVLVAVAAVALRLSGSIAAQQIDWPAWAYELVTAAVVVSIMTICDSHSYDLPDSTFVLVVFADNADTKPFDPSADGHSPHAVPV